MTQTRYINHNGEVFKETSAEYFTERFETLFGAKFDDKVYMLSSLKYIDPVNIASFLRMSYFSNEFKHAILKLDYRPRTPDSPHRRMYSSRLLVDNYCVTAEEVCVALHHRDMVSRWKKGRDVRKAAMNRVGMSHLASKKAVCVAVVFVNAIS